MTTTTGFQQQAAHRDAYATPEHVQTGNVTGVGYAVSVETGKPIPVYMNDTPPPPPPAPIVHTPAPQTVIVEQAPRDPWPARILSGGGAVAGTAAVVGHYAAGIAHVADATAVVAGVAAAGIALLRGSAPKVSVSVNATITGASSSSTSRSASGWRPQS
jgi:hypothetical protein